MYTSKQTVIDKASLLAQVNKVQLTIGYYWHKQTEYD